VNRLANLAERLGVGPPNAHAEKDFVRVNVEIKPGAVIMVVSLLHSVL
jgi:hypothetical protein